MAQTERDGQTPRRLSIWARAAVIGLGGISALLVAAGCGSSGSTSTAAAPTSAAAAPTSMASGGGGSAHKAKSVVISTSHSAAHGTILVSGNTLYTLKPSHVACTAACLKIWPAVLLPKGVKAAVAGPGVSASKLGTVARAGGVLQVTYSGQALYKFAEDTAPGQVNGDVTDTWGTWSDVVTAGQPATSAPTTAASTSATTAPASGGGGF